MSEELEISTGRAPCLHRAMIIAAIILAVAAALYFGRGFYERPLMSGYLSREELAQGAQCFDFFDKSSPEMNAAISDKMPYPASYSHISSRFFANVEGVGDVLLTSYRQKNGHGEIEIAAAVGRLNPKTCEVAIVDAGPSGPAMDLLNAVHGDSVQTALLQAAMLPLTIMDRAKPSQMGDGPNGAPSDSVEDPPATPTALNTSFPKVGTCYRTRVKQLSSRLTNADGTLDPQSGSAINFENGLYMVDYQVSSEVQRWAVGDKIKMCVTGVPESCPPGDNRGIAYRAFNLRTHGAWDAGDSEHMCGGA